MTERRIRGQFHGHSGHIGAHKPVMMVARKFRLPIREVRDILEAQKGPRT